MSQQPTLRIDWNNKGEPKRLVLSCAYADKEVAKVAARGTMSWKNTNKVWTMPIDPVIMKSLADTFPNLVISPDLWYYLEALRDKQLNIMEATQDCSPLPRDKVPLGDRLWDFQRASVRFLHKVGRGILGHDMGVGKTVIAATALKYAEARKVLIICPNSVKWSWVDHVIEWADCRDVFVLESGRAAVDDRAKVLCGDKDQRDRQIGELLSLNEQCVLVLNYDQARIHHKVLLGFTYDVIIADEAHRLKNRKALRTQVVARLSQSTQYLWLLTGTPTRNSYTDLWQLLNMCDPLRFSSYWNFVSVYMKTVADYWSGGQEVVGLRDPEEFNKMLSCYMFRKTKQEVMPDLPELVRTEHRLPLAPRQSQIYARMEREFVMSIKVALESGDTIERLLAAPNTVAQITRLRQICLTPAMLGAESDSAKLNALADLLEDLLPGGHRIIIYSNFRSFLPYAAQVVKKFDLPYAEIVGGQRGSDRDRVQKALTEGDISVVLGTIASMGEGMNLQAADVAIFCDRDWVPAVNEQAEARIHRGEIKTSPTVIYLWHPDTVEEDIRLTCRRKERIVNETTGRVESVRQMLLRRAVIRG